MRQKWVGKGIDRELCRRLIINRTNKKYMHKLESVLEIEMHKILWDFEIQMDHSVLEIQMDHSVLTRKPDFMLINKKKRTCHLVDFAILPDHKVKMKESKMRNKSLDLPRELKKLRNMMVMVMPIIAGTLGRIPKKSLEGLEIWGRKKNIQTTALLRVARILWRVLETWRDLVSLRLQ